MKSDFVPVLRPPEVHHVFWRVVFEPLPPPLAFKRLLRLAVSSPPAALAYGTVADHAEVSPDSKPSRNSDEQSRNTARPWLYAARYT